MKISLFTFLRNGKKLGYPFIESIKSALPLADEYLIALGPSDPDECPKTADLIGELNDPKIRIIESAWCENMKSDGYIYGQQKMVAQFQCTGDWAFYLEGDEVLHELELQRFYDEMLRAKDDKSVEALAPKFIHFFGDCYHYASSPAWYERAPRIIKTSVKTVACDGLFWNVVQSNRRMRWPRAREIDQSIYHYGHARASTAMTEKKLNVRKYWGKSGGHESHYKISPRFLKKFDCDHPEVMNGWIETYSNKSGPTLDGYDLTARDRRHLLQMWVERLIGFKYRHRNYSPVK